MCVCVCFFSIFRYFIFFSPCILIVIIVYMFPVLYSLRFFLSHLRVSRYDMCFSCFCFICLLSPKPSQDLHDRHHQDFLLLLLGLPYGFSPSLSLYCRASPGRNSRNTVRVALAHGFACNPLFCRRGWSRKIAAVGPRNSWKSYTVLRGIAMRCTQRNSRCSDIAVNQRYRRRRVSTAFVAISFSRQHEKRATCRRLWGCHLVSCNSSFVFF